MKRLLLLMLGLSVGLMASAQTIVTGTVVDENDQPLIGASIVVPETTLGTTTDVSGSFELMLRGEYTKVQISYLNYKTQLVDVVSAGKRTNLGTIKMELDAIAMEDIVITQSVAVQRRTPVAVSTVAASEIEFKLGGQESPDANCIYYITHQCIDQSGDHDGNILYHIYNQVYLFCGRVFV